jgi:hypothetical protein
MARAAYDKCFRAILGADYQSLKLTILLSCVKTFTKGSTYMGGANEGWLYRAYFCHFAAE